MGFCPNGYIEPLRMIHPKKIFVEDNPDKSSSSDNGERRKQKNSVKEAIMNRLDIYV